MIKKRCQNGGLRAAYIAFFKGRYRGVGELASALKSTGAAASKSQNFTLVPQHKVWKQQGPSDNPAPQLAHIRALKARETLHPFLTHFRADANAPTPRGWGLSPIFPSNIL